MKRKTAMSIAFAMAFCLFASALFAQSKELKNVKIVTDKSPDCSSLKSIVTSVTKDCKTNDEKALALYGFLINAEYHFATPDNSPALGALKIINSYGWGLCGSIHTVQGALCREMGWEWRYVGWDNPGHTTSEMKYDGKWHYFDEFLKLYTWKKDSSAPGGRTIASQEDIKADPSLVMDALQYDPDLGACFRVDDPVVDANGKVNPKAPAFLSCGDEKQDVISGVNSNKIYPPKHATEWNTTKFDDDPSYKTDINLSEGMILDLTWDKISDGWVHSVMPKHTCGNKDYRNSPEMGPILEPYMKGVSGPKRSWANGTLVYQPNFKSPSFLDTVTAKDNAKWENGALVAVDPSKPASITVDIGGKAYVMAKACGQGEGIETFEISTNEGKTFSKADISNFSSAVKGKFNCLAKLTFKKLTALQLKTLVMLNRSSLPYLVPGKNMIKISAENAADLGDRKLVCTIAYVPGSRTKSLEDLAKAKHQLYNCDSADWSGEPIYVRKAFSAKELPAEFEVNVSTPSGKFPVYPKMLFIRREIVAAKDEPSQQAELLQASWGTPLATPSGAGKLDIPANSKKLEIQGKPDVEDAILDCAQAGSPLGSTKRDNKLAKSKDGSSYFLMKFNVAPIPKNTKIVGAELSFYVWDPDDQDKGKVGVFQMKTPWNEASASMNSPEAGKKWSKGAFTIGSDTPEQPEGTVVVDVDQGGDEAVPPVEYKMNISKLVKAWIDGSIPNNGVAIGIIPDAEVDMGGNVRAQLMGSEHSNKQCTPKLVIYTE